MPEDCLSYPLKSNRRRTEKQRKTHVHGFPLFSVLLYLYLTKPTA